MTKYNGNNKNKIVKCIINTSWLDLIQFQLRLKIKIKSSNNCKKARKLKEYEKAKLTSQIFKRFKFDFLKNYVIISALSKSQFFSWRERLNIFLATILHNLHLSNSQKIHELIIIWHMLYNLLLSNPLLRVRLGNFLFSVRKYYLFFRNVITLWNSFDIRQSQAFEIPKYIIGIDLLHKSNYCSLFILPAYFWTLMNCSQWLKYISFKMKYLHFKHLIFFKIV